MLSGEKVTLRPIQKADYPTLYRYRNDLELEVLADDEPPRPSSFESYETFMQELDKKKDEGVGFTIEADGKVIGSVGLYGFDATSMVCELGISIGERDYLGKGYGADAVKVIVEYAFRYRNLHKVYLQVTANNERAHRSYLKCGFVEEGHLRRQLWSNGAYRDVIFMGILRTDWESSRSSSPG